MTWDTTTPLDSDNISLGDDKIREMKADLQTALRCDDVDGTEAIFPGSDAVNPIYRYRGLKGTTDDRPTAGQYGLYANETTQTLQRDSGSAWEDIATLIPSGTLTVFFQASAPTGWTKNTDHNDKTLRVVSGDGGGSGGTHGISSGFDFSHYHVIDYAGGVNTVASGNDVYSTDSDGAYMYSVSSGGAVSVRKHKNQTQNASSYAITPKYIDVILCAKD